MHLLPAFLTLAVVLAAAPPALGDDAAAPAAPPAAVDPAAADLARTWTLALHTQMFGTGAFVHTDAADVSRFDLTRAELGAILGFGARGGAELRFETIRSAAPQSAFGIDGNSLVVRANRAWAWTSWNLGVRLDLRGGLIPDPWIEAVEAAYDLRALAPTIGEASRLVDTADLGVATVLDWQDVVRVHLSVTNGEGRAQLEQNTGKTTSAVATVRVVELAGATLSAHGYARDGSVGAGSVRSHRLGGAITLDGPAFGAGVEGVHAAGAGERADVTALAVGAWAWARLVDDGTIGGIGVAGRFDLLTADGPDDAAGQTLAPTLAVYYDAIPGGDANLGVRAYLAGQLESSSDGGAALPGVPEAVDATRVMLVVSATGRMIL